MSRRQAHAALVAGIIASLSHRAIPRVPPIVQVPTERKNKYEPHQGKQECARRLRQAEKRK